MDRFSLHRHILILSQRQALPVPLWNQSRSWPRVGGPTHLQQEVGGVVDAHDQAAHSRHIVDVGEADEADGGQVVDEHDEEVLEGQVGEGGCSISLFPGPKLFVGLV